MVLAEGGRPQESLVRPGSLSGQGGCRQGRVGTGHTQYMTGWSLEPGDHTPSGVSWIPRCPWGLPVVSHLLLEAAVRSLGTTLSQDRGQREAARGAGFA